MREKPDFAAAAGLVLAVAIAMWPTFYNGFPIMLVDSGAYMVWLKDIWPFQPAAYVVFVRACSEIATLYSVVAAQAMICVGVMLLAFRRFGGARTVAGAVAVCCVLVLTQLPWLASFIMPDVFGGVGALCIVLLLLAERRFGPWTTALLLALTLFASLAATANALLFLPLGIACMAIRKWVLGSTISRRMWLGTIVYAVFAYSTPFILNGLMYGKPTLAMGSSARIFSKLVDHGFAQEFLAKHCPTERIPACAIQRQLQQIQGGEGFLWTGEPPLADSTGAWRDSDGSWSSLARRIAISQWRGVLKVAVTDSWSTLGQLSWPAGWLVPHVHDSVWSRVSTVHPDLLHRYEAARQQSGEIRRNFPERFYWLSTLVSYLLTLALLVWHAARGDRMRAAFACAIIAAVLGNAIVHGALGAPIARYNAIGSWLAWLVPAMFALQQIETMRAQSGERTRAP